jgi:hypothetical protein
MEEMPHQNDRAASRVLGVNIAAGIAYLALVKVPETVELDRTAKLAPATNVEEWTQLKQFAMRVVEEARAAGAVRVVFAEPRRYNAWKYYEAFTRASLQVSASLALHDAGISVSALAQRTACATLDLDLGELDVQLAKALKINPRDVSHWKERAPAVAVALHVARGVAR